MVAHTSNPSTLWADDSEFKAALGYLKLTLFKRETVLTRTFNPSTWESRAFNPSTVEVGIGKNMNGQREEYKAGRVGCSLRIHRDHFWSEHW